MSLKDIIGDELYSSIESMIIADRGTDDPFLIDVISPENDVDYEALMAELNLLREENQRLGVMESEYDRKFFGDTFDLALKGYDAFDNQLIKSLRNLDELISDYNLQYRETPDLTVSDYIDMELSKIKETMPFLFRKAESAQFPITPPPQSPPKNIEDMSMEEYAAYRGKE